MIEMPDDPQNVYDDAEFFAGYSRLERFGEEWGAAFEHADFVALLPNPSGLRVLDLGCGAGQLSLYLAHHGAAEVVGVDVSETMLELARSERAGDRITYIRESMESLRLPQGRFDLVVSSLAFHYVEDYASLMGRIAAWLTPGGHLVYSTEHPVFTARASDDGWVRNPSGDPQAWAIDRYAIEGRREEHWFRPGVVKFHRTVSTLLTGLLDAGLSIERVVEPSPTDAALKDHPNWEYELKRPTFLLIRAGKSSSVGTEKTETSPHCHEPAGET
jgi:SAM-dependent methyltransferase